MVRKTSIAVMAGMVAVAIASAAEAAPRNTTVVAQAQPRQQTVYTYTDENGRRRTKIIVQRRSYLDAGTEVLPGQRKYNDYATQLLRDPTEVLGPGRGGHERNPLSPYWEFGGRGGY